MPRRKLDRTSLVARPPDRATSNSNNTNGSSITLSDAYQGNILLYRFLRKHTPQVLLERNVSRVLAHHADVINRKDKDGDDTRRSGKRRRGDRDVDGESRFKRRKKKWVETMEKLLLVPDFENGPVFGVLPDKLRLIQDGNPAQGVVVSDHRVLLCKIELAMSAVIDGEKELKFEKILESIRLMPDAEDKTIINVKLHRPFEIPFSAFAVERDGLSKFADAYEIQLLVSSQDNDDSLELGRLSLVESHKTLLNNPIVGVFNFDGSLKFASPSEAHMLYRDVNNPIPGIAMTIKHAWKGRINFIKPPIKKSTTDRRRKHGSGPSTENSDEPSSPGPRRSVSMRDETAISSPRRSKNGKIVQIDYSFRGSVKNFDDQDQNNRSKFHINDKTYTFETRRFGYTCILCQKTFEALERLRFHLKNTHLLFAFRLADHKPSKLKDVARIAVDLAVESTSSKLSVHQLNSRKFTWMKPRRSKVFNLTDYLEGDNSWTTARVGLSETERKMMNGPGRVCKRKGIVPRLARHEEGRQKRVCVLPAREDGKGFVRFQTGEEVHAGDEVSESGDEVDEQWLEKRVEERIDGSDIPANAKAFMQLWAAHIWAERPKSNYHLHDCLIRFCRKYKRVLHKPPLRRELEKLAIELRAQGQVSNLCLKECWRTLDQHAEKLREGTETGSL
ncbi:hypothetical protein TWF694_003997 [Orbilia ellipsospora]|uniref:C2H2-type domain-containing protein n=1 Tax=Orbilia ellipsospora TaxID=2528407 RepID=A0AAV9WWN0_9PEZI